MKKSIRYLSAATLLLLSGMLTGCARPGDDDITRLLKQTYACKNMEVIEIVKTDSLPGIYSYVAQYGFHLRFKDGEEGAKKFFQGLFAEQEVKGKDWEQWMRQEKVQEYLGNECSEAAEIMLERMTEFVLPQIADKNENVRIHILMPIAGWSEFMPGRKGWDITMRRDKVGGEPLMSEPIKRELLLPKQGDKSKKSDKK